MKPGDLMPRVPMTCYKLASEWNSSKVEILFVPKHYKKGRSTDMFVGPGYWSPSREKDVYAPKCKYNHTVYDKEQLLKAGAIPVVEALWE